MDVSEGYTYEKPTEGLLTRISRKINKKECNQEQIFIEQDGNEVYLTRSMCNRLVELCIRWGIM